MTPHTDNEKTPNKPTGITLGFNWIADLKVRFGGGLRNVDGHESTLTTA